MGVVTCASGSGAKLPAGLLPFSFLSVALSCVALVVRDTMDWDDTDHDVYPSLMRRTYPDSNAELRCRTATVWSTQQRSRPHPISRH